MRRLQHLRTFVLRARADPLSRTSALLITDNITLALIGAICSVIMARLWPASSVGAVASIIGAMNILVIASVLGMPTTIVRFLGGEPRQRRLLRQALLLTSAIAAVAAVVIALVPGHLGVPLADLDLRPTLLAALMAIYAVATVVVTVGDPSYVARQEVSFMLGKDLFASTIRIVLILAVSHSRAQSLFLAAFGYTAVAGGVDLIILSRRLHDDHSLAPASASWLSPLRDRFSFAIGIHVALVVASIPIYLLPAITNALTGAADSAFVAMALQVGTALTLVASQTGQSLLSDLSRSPDQLVHSTLRALRGAYMVTLPVAALIGGLAPYVLLLFGPRYSHHGSSFLRWSAAGSIFFVFNYIGDVILLARHRVAGYLFVNVAGTVILMSLVVLALTRSFSLLGPAWFVGQGAYATMSALIVARHVTPERRREIARELAVMLGRDRRR